MLLNIAISQFITADEKLLHSCVQTCFNIQAVVLSAIGLFRYLAGPQKLLLNIIY